MQRRIDPKRFKQEVIDSFNLAVVQFKSEWSGACQIIAPIYEELAKSYEGSATFFISDIGADKSLEKEFGIHEVPTILFFMRGEVVDYVVGLTSKNTLIAKIENALSTQK